MRARISKLNSAKKERHCTTIQSIAHSIHPSIHHPKAGRASRAGKAGEAQQINQTKR
jgi:hypothetical protein